MMRVVARGGWQWVRLGTLLVLLVGCGVALYLPGSRVGSFAGFTADAMTEPELQQRLRLPDGFSINTYATGIDNARLMRFTPAGDLLVSAPRQGKVFLLARDADGDGRADGQRTLLADLHLPHGLVLHDGWLYVAEAGAVLRARFDAATGQVRGEPEDIVRGLPIAGNHFTRTIAIGPDGWLYVSVGSTCNVCIERDKRHASILRYRLDGSGEELYATGLRNAVGFAWQPVSGDLYATDNGRDNLGDDFPPCELNRVVAGGFYGWPFANGDRVPDPDFGDQRPDLVAASIPPAHRFGAHTAPLGMTFYTGTAFPPRYRGAAFVAQHGSSRTSRLSGYQVVALRFGPDGTIAEEPFLTGFEIDQVVAGRPVDVAVGPDGALYVSDDFTGSIYRVAYGAPARGSNVVAAPTGAVRDPLAGLDADQRANAAARGRRLWESHRCATCHLPGQGSEPHRPLAQLRRKYTLDSLAAYLRAPQPPMPAYPLSEAERRDLSVYLLASVD